MLIDLHNHTKLCNHASGEMEEYVLKAIEARIDVFGFSDHAPMNFDEYYRMGFEQMGWYENQVKMLREKYNSKIDIRLAYEVDFLPNYMDNRVLDADVDYLIGSVHYLNKWGFDNPEYIGEYQNKDIDIIWEEYFAAQIELVKSGYFDVLGHLDLLKLFNYLPKKDIRLLAQNLAKALKQHNMCFEINGAGYNKPIKEQYPSKILIELMFETGVEVTFGSDAHTPTQVSQNLVSNLELAKTIGYTKARVFKNKDKESVVF